MANSADPDQLASEEASWSGSSLFAKAGFSMTMVKTDTEGSQKYLVKYFWRAPVTYAFVEKWEKYQYPFSLHLYKSTGRDIPVTTVSVSALVKVLKGYIFWIIGWK